MVKRVEIIEIEECEYCGGTGECEWYNGHRGKTIVAVEKGLGVCDRVAKWWLQEAGLWRK